MSSFFVGHAQKVVVVWGVVVFEQLLSLGDIPNGRRVGSPGGRVAHCAVRPLRVVFVVGHVQHWQKDAVATVNPDGA